MIPRPWMLVALVFICFFVPQNMAFPGPPRELLRPSLSYGAEQNFYTGFKDASTELSAFAQQLSFSYYGVSFTYRKSFYNWKDAGELGFYDGGSVPWDKVHSMSVSMRRPFPVTDTIMLLAGIRASSAFERQVANSFGAGGDVFFIKSLGDAWSVAAGAVASWHPVHSAVLPAAGFRYDDKAVPGFSVSIGMPTGVDYRINEELAISLEAGMVSRTYRLKDNSEVFEKGYFRKSALVPGLGLEYSPRPNVEFDASGFYYFDRKLRLYDSSGSRQESSRLDSGPGVSFGATFRF